MHYKDGTPAILGDIIQHDSGKVGILIGGQIGNDYCSSTAVWFNKVTSQNQGLSYIGFLRDTAGKEIGSAMASVSFDTYTQTRECVKIGHIDL